MEWVFMLDPNFRLDINKDAETIRKLEHLRVECNIDNQMFARGIEASDWGAERFQRQLYERGRKMNPRASDKEIFKEIIMSRSKSRIPLGLDITEEEADKAIESMGSIDDLVKYILLKESQEPPWPDPLGVRSRIEEILRS